MIQIVGNLLILNKNSNDILVLSTAFDSNSDVEKINLKLIFLNIPKVEKNKCGEWINWITQSNYGRETIFGNVVKALKTYFIGVKSIHQELLKWNKIQIR